MILKPIKAKAPCLNGLPKIHKDDMPIRPVVDHTSAPSYRLAAKLERVIKAGIVWEENYSLKNTYDFINNSKDLKLSSSHKLASLDVVNMYTNIPVEETIKIVEEYLIRSKVYNLLVIDDIIRFLRVVLRQNYFSFNGEVFLQKEGLAMGSPLSGLLANIYMNHFERKYIMSKYKSKIIYYGRYVDDTFLIFDGTHRQLQKMVSELNKTHPSIRLTLEFEHENALNFLDVTVKKGDGSLLYNVYRKPTTTDNTIHKSSYHPISHKMAAFNSFVHRAVNFPLSDEDRKKEIDTIKHIAVMNGYNCSLVDNLLQKHTKRSLLPRPPKEEVKYITSDFNNLFALPIANFLRRSGMRVAFSTSNNLYRLLKEQNHKPVPLKEKTGVYRVNCGSCKKFYIGQTGRSFGVRFKEHLPKKSNSTSNFARHLMEEDHEYGGFDADCKPLHICNNGPHLNTLEEFEIYRAYKLDPNNILNDKLCFNTNVLYDLAINA